MSKFLQSGALMLLSLVSSMSSLALANEVEFRCDGQAHLLLFNPSIEQAEIKGKSSGGKWFDLTPSDIEFRRWRSGEMLATASVSGPADWESPERGVTSDGVLELAFDKVMNRYVTKIFLKQSSGEYELLPVLSLTCK